MREVRLHGGEETRPMGERDELRVEWVEQGDGEEEGVGEGCW